MKMSLWEINCRQHDSRTQREKPFRVVRCEFNYKTNATDTHLLNSILEKGKELAALVNPRAANYAITPRSYDKILNSCVAGLLSEWLWKKLLNRRGEIVAETEFHHSKTQIDLQVLSSRQKIEVRSSFPRNGISFAICSHSHEFDVIGPYANHYKPEEIQKDYYVRTLFHLAKVGEQKDIKGRTWPIVERLIDKLQQDGFEAYLTGGATWQMMNDDSISKNKDFIPEDEISLQRLGVASQYRVVPFHKALDTIEVCDIIRENNLKR